jgi:hypothetical protein
LFAVAAGEEPPEFKKLTDIAARHRVPMPAKDARLVLAHTESWSVVGNQTTSRDPGIYAPAFLLEERANGSIVVLRGMERKTLQGRRESEPLWRPFSDEPVKPKLGGHAVTLDNLSTFVCAVQLAARGDEANAERLWKRFSAAGWWDDGEFGEDIAAQLKDPSLLLARCIFDHLHKQYLQDPANLRDSHARMKSLFDEFPKLKTPARQKLFESLAATIAAKPAAAGSTEALLLKWAQTPSSMRHLGIFHEGPQSAAEAPAREIVLRGFDAIPDLIALVEDRRTTVHQVQGFNRIQARTQTVGELAAHLLGLMAGMDSHSEQSPADAAAWRTWWETARKQGERKFFASAVFGRKEGQIIWVHAAPVQILAKKYPAELRSLCEEFSKQASPETQPFALAEAVAESSLDKEDRLKTLVAFAQRGSLEHQRCVLQNLAKLDGARCAQLLKPILEKLPEDAKGSYWTCPEASFTHVVMQIEDDEIWRTYLRAAKRSSVGLRMEMMNPMNYAYIGAKNRERRLAFLAAFLEDEAVREMPKERGKFDGPCAGFTFPKIAVRDFAALQIATILRMAEFPDEFWSAAQWSKFREKVRTKLAGEKLPKLDVG